MESNPLIIQCPHCGLQIIIEQINCAIFRHGMLKLTGEQIPPHSSKTTCDQLIQMDLVYGCAKPFRLVQDSSGCWIGVICDYI